MKKIFSLLMLIVALVTTQGAYAQKTYEISSNCTNKPADKGASPWNFVIDGKTFTITNSNSKTFNKGDNTKLNGGVKFSKATTYTLSIPSGMKATSISFKGYSNKDNNTSYLTYNGTDNKDDVFMARNATNFVANEYTYDWPDNTTSVTFAPQGQETVFVITITEAASDKLSVPTFSYDEVAGKVTINAYGAKEIRYTTDGSEPSATNGTVYSEPFEASNITVKAIAISDGTKSNSDVATYQVPAKLLSTSIALTKVTIAGVELSAENLQKLLTDKTLALTEEYAVAPAIIFTKTTTMNYDGGTVKNIDEDETATVTRGDEYFTTSTTLNGETYTITLPIKKGIDIAKPTISSVNGTVVIKCATEGVKLSYKIGDGEYQDYIHSFTLLDEDAVVTAKASLEGSTDAISDPYTVEVVKNTVKTKRIMFDNSMFTLTANVKDVSNAKLTGNAGTDAEGYWMELNNNQKSFSTGSDITVDGTKYKSIKGSNGAENILHLPNGIKASRFIIYSYVNKDAADNNICGWSEVNGDQDYKNVPSESYKDAANPDVRVFPIADDATQIAFNNAGYQMCFVYALDIVDETEATTKDITLSAAGMGTFSSTTAYELPKGLTAYIATCDGSKVTLTKVEDGIVAANQGVVLSGEKNGKYTLTPSTKTSATDWTKNELKNTASAAFTTAADDQSTYVLIANNNGNGQFARLNGGQTIPVGKAYLTVEGNDAKTLSLSFGETNGINAVENNAEQNGAYYTLSGQKTMKPVKGLYIHNGKKYIAK